MKKQIPSIHPSIMLSPTSRVFSKKSPSRLGTYLATAVGSCGLSTSADAAIVNIDLTNVQGNNITGPNGGITAGSNLTISNWLGAFSTGQIEIYNDDSGYNGLGSSSAFLQMAVTGTGYASPRNFGSGSIIDSSATWTSASERMLFEYDGSVSAYFGANSFMGFRFGTDFRLNTSPANYGWIEVTWDGTNFEIISAAYESTPDTPILAGATAVPEPSTLAALVLGGTALVARRRRKQEAADTAEQAV
ncbi:MAG: PEP-CTERM sorting domain-containing protein [Luteolibacter sp.]